MRSDAIAEDPKAVYFSIRIGFLIFLILFSYTAIRLSFAIEKSEMIIKEMLSGSPLPAITRFVISTSLLWKVLSFGLPSLAT